MSFRPLRDRILVERAPVQERIGSIWLPETAQERPHHGTVIATGPKVTWVQEGDRIQYSAKGRPDLKLDGVLHNIIAEQDIYGVVE